MIVFDANYRSPLWKSSREAAECMRKVLSRVDILKVNETELQLLADHDGFERGKICESLLALGPALIVITLGPQGSYFQTCSERGKVPGFEVESIDPIGCGDSFVGALIYRLLRGENWRDWLQTNELQDILRFANAAGALTSTRKGVIPILPRLKQVEEFLVQGC